MHRNVELVLAAPAEGGADPARTARLQVLPDAVATAAAAAAALGVEVGQIGHPAPIRTLVDRALEAFDEVCAAGGIPHAVFPTTFAGLVAVTGGEAADVA